MEEMLNHKGTKNTKSHEGQVFVSFVFFEALW
jgi:hypothetical protein